MKPTFHIILFLCFSLRVASGQEVLFFSDGTTPDFYDQGIADLANLGSSSFETTSPPGYPQYNDKIPCSPLAWKGNSSLKFNYVSSPQGNWNATVFRPDWSEADISRMDSLIFHIWSDPGLPAEALPLIGVRTMKKEGAGEVSSRLYPLSQFNGEIPPRKWTAVTFPLNIIADDTENSLTDLAASKGIIFAQSENNNSARTILIDEIMAFKTPENLQPVTRLKAEGYDSHSELTWETPDNNLNFRIYASFDGGNSYSVRGETSETRFLDFFPPEGRNQTISYRVASFVQNMEGAAAETTATTRDFSDEELLDMLQRYTFRYFREGAHPTTGMAPERSNGNANTVASGASAMGLMAMIVAHEREFHPKEEIKNQILTILAFLETCDRYHGAWSHWYEGNSGKTIPFSTYDDGGDLVETSFVAQALIALRNYFTDSDHLSVLIREKATRLWEEIDWEWYRQGGQNVLYWHWSPTHGFRMNMKISGWNESLITYLMAAASPAHPVPAEVYHQGWARNGQMVNKRTFYDQEIRLSPDWGGPLFWIHYTFLGINPHGLTDQYADYLKECVNTVKIHHAYAIANPGQWKNYGANCWGLTASDDPSGYSAHRPVTNDNGTIAPTAALSSIPFAPEEAIGALKYFYRERGKELWGEFGPYDAFNDHLGWVKKAYLGIDQGPIIVMTENFRSGLLWKLVMKDSDVQAALDKLGFQYEPVTRSKIPEEMPKLRLNPQPAAEKVTITLPAGSKEFRISIFNINGKLVSGGLTIPPFTPEFAIDLRGWPPGLYLVTATDGIRHLSERLILSP